MGLMNIYKKRAKNSLSFMIYTEQTQVPRCSASKIDGGLKNNFPHTGTSKDLFCKGNLLAGVLNMWHRYNGEILFWKHSKAYCQIL